MSVHTIKTQFEDKHFFAIGICSTSAILFKVCIATEERKEIADKFAGKWEVYKNKH
jgi:hypothetical protein